MIGIIARVRVNLTMVAASRVFVLYRLSQALAVAVTEEVSLTAVPQREQSLRWKDGAKNLGLGK